MVTSYTRGVGWRGDTIIHGLIVSELQLFTLTLESRGDTHPFSLRLQMNGNHTQLVSSYRTGRARGYFKLMQEATLVWSVGSPHPKHRMDAEGGPQLWRWLVPAS